MLIYLSQKMIFRNELIERHHLYLLAFSRGLRDHLKALLFRYFIIPSEGAQILEIPTEKLTQLLRKASRGRFTENKAKELKELASNSFAAMLSSDMATLLIRQMLEQIDLLEKQISEIEKIIAMQFAQFKTKLATIPGIGTTLGATILSEIGDINRFEKPKQLIAFAGMDPSIKQSGNFVGTESHMSKRGSPFLRRAVWLAAVVAVSHDPLFKYYFQQKMHSGKSYSQAMGFICHKLLNTIFAILKSGEDFNRYCNDNYDSWVKELGFEEGRIAYSDRNL